MHDQHFLEEAADDGCQLIRGRDGGIEILPAERHACCLERGSERSLGVILKAILRPLGLRPFRKTRRADVDLVHTCEQRGLEGGEEPRTLGDARDIGCGGPARGTDELDRDVEQPSSRSSTNSRTSGASRSCGTVTPPSTARRQRPMAARRRPYGSREPVGRWPRENDTVSVSILSAAESTQPACVSGSGASTRVGQVVLGDRDDTPPPGGRQAARTPRR